jgi:hypothetical protein
LDVIHARTHAIIGFLRIEFAEKLQIRDEDISACSKLPKDVATREPSWSEHTLKPVSRVHVAWYRTQHGKPRENCRRGDKFSPRLRAQAVAMINGVQSPYTKSRFNSEWNGKIMLIRLTLADSLTRMESPAAEGA